MIEYIAIASGALGWGAVATLALWRAQANYRRRRDEGYHAGYLAGLRTAQQGMGALMGGNRSEDPHK